MSSFVVAPKVINQIVTFLDKKSAQSTVHEYTYHQLLTKFRLILNIEFSLGDQSETLQKLADSLWDLNIEAVHQRYGDEDVNTMPGTYENQMLVHHTPYQFEDATMIQVYKSLRCLIYQCSEGTVPRKPLYKFLEELESTIAEHIVSELPEYERAKWG